MTLTYTKVIEVISKPPDRRTEFEVTNLFPWFRKKSKLFRPLKTEFLFDLIKNAQFVTKQNNDVIIRQGNQGDCMYILLRGQVTIYIDYTAKANGDVELPKLPTEMPVDEKALRDLLGTFVCSLGPGTTFGEVALFSEDCIRTASIIADEVSDLIVVDRELYNRSVKYVLQKEFEDKTNFIAKNPLFGSWTPKYKKQLSMALQKETLPYEAILSKQGEPVHSIYFILSGEVKVVMDPTQHTDQYPQLTTPAQINGFPFATDQDIRRDTQRSQSARSGSASRQRRIRRQLEEVCLLGANEAIGDIEVLMNLDTYMQTTVCTRRTEVLVLEMKHFERILVKRNPRTIETMKLGLEVRLRARCTFQTQKHVPILKQLLNKAAAFKRRKEEHELAMLGGKLKERNSEQKNPSNICSHFVPKQGLLVDMFGPGTVFYRIRQQEKARLRRVHQSGLNTPNSSTILHKVSTTDTMGHLNSKAP